MARPPQSRTFAASRSHWGAWKKDKKSAVNSMNCCQKWMLYRWNSYRTRTKTWMFWPWSFFFWGVTKLMVAALFQNCSLYRIKNVLENLEFWFFSTPLFKSLFSTFVLIFETAAVLRSWEQALPRQFKLKPEVDADWLAASNCNDSDWLSSKVAR